MGKDQENKAEGSEDVQPVSNDVLNKILTQLAQLTQKVGELSKEETQEDEAEGDDEADAAGKVAEAVAADRDRLKAINDSCSGRADFAVTQFLADKSATEAKAALADVLTKELAEAHKRSKFAATGEGTEPVASGGAKDINSDDPEAIWANSPDIQKQYNGKKPYFLARQKAEKAKALRNK